ncbi:hypothetical protein L6R52_10720, partial [Myxococcota bacterium]|nr:hypothetical protein [Myxococcota bacterium]
MTSCPNCRAELPARDGATCPSCGAERSASPASSPAPTADPSAPPSIRPAHLAILEAAGVSTGDVDGDRTPKKRLVS